MINIFATIISDAYKKDEKPQIAAALNDLCNPRDGYGWSSAGIYSFWDYSTKEIYYIGLAVDFEDRFKQHNGLIPADPNTCKKEQIEEYFKHNEKLGYSIFVQSPLSQPITSKNQDVWRNIYDEDFSEMDMRSSKGRNDLKIVEGILIESYKKYNGKLPSWNSVGGSKSGQKRATKGNFEIVKSFSNQSLLVSKSTLRELSANPVFEGYENVLFTIRYYMLYFGITWGQSYKITERFDTFGRLKEMNENGYINKQLIL